MNNSKIALSGLVLSAMTMTLASPAQASLYRSASGSTQLGIIERNVSAEKHTGSYVTVMGGQTWNGSFKAIGEGILGSYLYQGEFEDSPAGKPNVKCTGTIQMSRRPLGRSATMSLETTWNVMGGTQCPSIGKMFKLTLIESLPKANAKGDYTEGWGRWKVTSTDGKLNCRATPNGKILLTFQGTDTITIDGRAGGPFTRLNGDSWMYLAYPRYPATDADFKPCYVRANSQYIQPLSIGF